jgi:type VI secretion system protein ImpF
VSGDESASLTAPSVLDRIIDDDPTTTRDRPKSHSQLLDDLRASVMRDVGNLLNTRRRPLPAGVAREELSTSLASYGIQDFTSASLSTDASKERFRAEVEETLRRFEPRFRTVRVEVLANLDKLDRTLRLRIDALLHADPAPEPIVFDSVLDPVNGGFEVRG